MLHKYANLFSFINFDVDFLIFFFMADKIEVKNIFLKDG